MVSHGHQETLCDAQKARAKSSKKLAHWGRTDTGHPVEISVHAGQGGQAVLLHDGDDQGVTRQHAELNAQISAMRNRRSINCGGGGTTAVPQKGVGGAK